MSDNDFISIDPAQNSNQDNYALKRVNPSVVALYIFIQPVISAVTGYYILGEVFNWQMAIATTITFAGVMLATSASNKGIFIRQAQVPEKEQEAVLNASSDAGDQQD